VPRSTRPLTPLSETTPTTPHRGDRPASEERSKGAPGHEPHRSRAHGREGAGAERPGGLQSRAPTCRSGALCQRGALALIRRIWSVSIRVEGTRQTAVWAVPTTQGGRGAISASRLPDHAGSHDPIRQRMESRGDAATVTGRVRDRDDAVGFLVDRSQDPSVRSSEAIVTRLSVGAEGLEPPASSL